MAEKIEEVHELTTPATIPFDRERPGNVTFFFAEHTADIELCQETADEEGLLVQAGSVVQSGPWQRASAPRFLRAEEETTVRVTVVRGT